ncbi:MAG: hypothetical protein D6823_08380, partial [Chloroflexi bacterium]
DHGICFHVEPKLRTVLWDFVDEPLPDEVITAFTGFRQQLDHDPQLTGALHHLLDRSEVRALRRRLDNLLASGRYPPPGPGPHVPWPPV